MLGARWCLLEPAKLDVRPGESCLMPSNVSNQGSRASTPADIPARPLLHRYDRVQVGRQAVLPLQRLSAIALGLLSLRLVYPRT